MLIKIKNSSQGPVTIFRISKPLTTFKCLITTIPLCKIYQWRNFNYCPAKRARANNGCVSIITSVSWRRLQVTRECSCFLRTKVHETFVRGKTRNPTGKEKNRFTAKGVRRTSCVVWVVHCFLGTFSGGQIQYYICQTRPRAEVGNRRNTGILLFDI